MDSLPTLPSLYKEIMEELQSKDPSIKKIGAIISKDVAMTAKILQLVNSAFFGIPRRISTPAEACSLLGIETIEALVLSIQIFSQLSGGIFFENYIEKVYHHSIATGLIARALAQKEAKDKSVWDDAFMSGLLHDVGKIVFVSSFPEDYREVLQIAEKEKSPLREVEKSIFGTMHAEVGAFLMGLWGMSDPIVEALAFHHNPGHCPALGFSPLTAVHAANSLHHELSEESSGKAAGLFDMGYLERLKLSDHVSDWRTTCERLFQEEGNDGR